MKAHLIQNILVHFLKTAEKCCFRHGKRFCLLSWRL